MKVRFLLDENLSPRLATALCRSRPHLDVLWVGSAGAPATGTPDPELLVHLNQTGRALVTDNRHTIPGHVVAHHAAGGHHWGIFLTRPGAGLRTLVDAPVLVWDASEAEEWIDDQQWIPF
ncbi:MAG: DUF5615 family PIN-like protein [Chloroflexi bacterium]|nr:DUF5615 family PIN-like protein [Chloroflexota bacterium]